MPPDEIETVTEEELSLQRSEQSFIDKAEEFMRPLLEAGFNVQSVLERGLEYMVGYISHADWAYNRLMAAQYVRQAARNLHIDAESQLRASRMASEEIRQRIGVIR